MLSNTQFQHDECNVTEFSLTFWSGLTRKAMKSSIFLSAIAHGFFKMFQMLSKLESLFNVSRTDDVLFLNLIHIVTLYPCYTGLSKKCFKKDMMYRFPKHAILANVRTSNGQLIIKILFNFDRVQFSVNEYRNSRNTQQTSRQGHSYIERCQQIVYFDNHLKLRVVNFAHRTPTGRVPAG